MNYYDPFVNSSSSFLSGNSNSYGVTSGDNNGFQPLSTTSPVSPAPTQTQVSAPAQTQQKNDGAPPFSFSDAQRERRRRRQKSMMDEEEEEDNNNKSLSCFGSSEIMQKLKFILHAFVIPAVCVFAISKSLSAFFNIVSDTLFAFKAFVVSAIGSSSSSSSQTQPQESPSSPSYAFSSYARQQQQQQKANNNNGNVITQNTTTIGKNFIDLTIWLIISYCTFMLTVEFYVHGYHYDNHARNFFPTLALDKLFSFF